MSSFLEKKSANLARRDLGLRPFDTFFADPFRGPMSMLDSIDGMLDGMFGSTVGLMPRANISTTATGSRIELEAPGLAKEDFRVEVADDVLTISSHVEKKQEDVGRREFSRSTFSRSWTLPRGVIQADIKASYEAGILTVDVPHYHEPEPAKKVRTIDVK